jgi:hypothetical protein
MTPDIQASRRSWPRRPVIEWNSSSGLARLRNRAFDPDPLVHHEAFRRSLWTASENYLLMRPWLVTEAHITIALLHDQYTRADPGRAHEVHAALIEVIDTGT